MATIEQNLTLLQNTKSDIMSAINDKGGSLSSADTFASYADEIEGLSDPSLKNLIQGSGNVAIPDGITTIRPYKFAEQSGMLTATIPSTCTSIGAHAFEGSSLTSVTVPDSVTSIGAYCFYTCTDLDSIHVGTGVTSVPEQFAAYGHLASVVFDGDITSIGNNAFEYSSISVFDFKPSLRTIGTQAFKETALYGTVELNEGLTTVGSSAFHQCTDITAFVFPSTITSIGDGCFQRCNRLATVTCKATTPPTLGTSVFPTAVTNIYVPSESVAAYKAATNWSAYASKIQAIPA